MEKLTIKPENIRGAGNILESLNMNPSMGKVTSGTGTINGASKTVYELGYLPSSKLTLTVDRTISTSASSFTVGAVLKDGNDTAINSATVYCEVNGTVTSSTTNGSGEVSFTITTNEQNVYYIKVYYEGTSLISGCVAYTRVYAIDATNLTLVTAPPSVIASGDTLHLVGTLTGTNFDGDPIGVPGQTIKFYEVWTPTLTVSSTPQIIQSGDTATIEAVLKDEDGSRIKGETIKIYKITED